MNLRENLEKNDIFQKLLSIGIAILLWSFVMGIVDPEIKKEFRNIPVRIDGIEAVEARGLSYIDPKEPKVDISIAGPRSDMVDLTNENIQVAIDVSNLGAGLSRVPIEISWRNFYGRVNINNTDPEYLEVQVDVMKIVNLDIDVEIEGSLQEGYALGEVEPVTKNVNVKLPSARLGEAHRAVAVVELDSDRTENFITSSEIIIENRAGEPIDQIETDIDYVDIEVPIERIKSVPVELNFTGSLPEDQILEDINIQPKNVVISGPSSIIEGIDSVKTMPIDYSNLSGKSKINVELDLPDGINLREDENHIVFTYSIRDSISKTIEKHVNSIEIENANEAYTYQLEDIGPILVELYGEASSIEAINEDSLRLFVNVDNLGPGTYQVYIRSDQDHVRTIEPNRINIQISPNNQENNS